MLYPYKITGTTNHSKTTKNKLKKRRKESIKNKKSRVEKLSLTC